MVTGMKFDGELTRLEKLIRVRRDFLKTSAASNRTRQFRLDICNALSEEIEKIGGV